MPVLAYSSRQARRSWRQATDRQLLAAVAGGDEDAFAGLIERKTGPLLVLATRLLGDREEARDVVQAAFLRVWEHRRRFEPRWSPNTWLYRITANLAIDQLRSRRSQARGREPFRWHLRRVADWRHRRDLAALQEKEVARIFEELAAGLSDRQRAVFVLRALEGLPSREVAAILGCRASTVRNHLFSARKKLREELLKRFPEYATERP